MDTQETLQTEGLANNKCDECDRRDGTHPVICSNWRKASPSGWQLQMDAGETLTVYQSLRNQLRILASQEDPALDSISTVVGLMRELRPAAVEASATLQSQQNGCP